MSNAKATEFKTIKDLAAAIHAGKVKWSKIEGVTPVFRLNPPRKGFKQGRPRLDKQMAAERSSQKRLYDRQVGCVSSVCAGEESRSAG